jgi:hypothetical protein
MNTKYEDSTVNSSTTTVDPIITTNSNSTSGTSMSYDDDGVVMESGYRGYLVVFGGFLVSFFCYYSLN